ncbi:maleylacetoacetate isomerase [Hyphobacterium sp. CCMP332]|jgi:maleylacetoacetate isomerase|uniref:maleylacetoacetate isomerase n=1 Tax=Hyphobacterium sp. CCMP332 TaxID=2749086 RepID=UPI00164FD37B|nr:maleylacetoacetate isomerase [Hyphobacterium sp. CCMP332]QNL18316.1 maleylacetoacetate isomerase [Hyphobacterium sp. CCMP332]
MTTLHGYWRSGTSYRLRIALNLKGIAYDQVPVNLKDGEQRQAAYKKLNPQGLVPLLDIDGVQLIQSPALLEYLDETHPEPPLLPGSPVERARIRAYAAVIGCDIHPLQNLRVLQYIRAEHGQDADGVTAWAQRWIRDGFTALEAMVTADGRGGPYLWGSKPTLADIYLVPQMYNARRFGVDLAAFPRLVAADEAARAHPAFEAAKPENQPDAPEDGH